MNIGMIGLGKMGANMVARLIKGGDNVVAYDINEASIKAVEELGASGARTIEELVEKLPLPRLVWVMVPSGKITDDTITALAGKLSKGDTIIDGGNSNYKDSMRHAVELAEKELNFIDVGTSGGIWGLAEGYSMMIGGDKEVVENFRPIFETLAPAADLGWGYVGPAGKAKKEFGLKLAEIAEIWRYGSVVRSWLLDLTAEALTEDEDLSALKAWVSDSGEGRWTVFEAIDLDVAAPVITLSLQRRIRSRMEEPYSDKLLAAMRNKFGGHAVKKTQ